MSVSSDFLKTQIEKIKAQIIAIDDAILKLSTNATLSYTLDTGQDRQVVTRFNLSELERTSNSLYNKLDVLCIRAGLDTSSIYVRPCF